MSSTVASDPRVPGHTITQWAQSLLAKLFPGSTTNGSSLSASAESADTAGLITWANTESSGYNPNKPGGLNNPLNTTEGALGFSGQGGSQGDIKDFATFDQGVAAQAYNLEHTQGAGYQPILDALRQGNESALFSAVDSSAFGTKGLGKGGTPSGPALTTSSPTATGADMATLDSFSILNPGTWLGGILGGAKSDVTKVGITLAVLGSGLTLVVLGAYKSVSPHVPDSVKTAAMAAAA